MKVCFKEVTYNGYMAKQSSYNYHITILRNGIIDKEKNFTPVKSEFKTAAQANHWSKKNLPKDEVHLWGAKLDYSKSFRYFIQMKG